jgi:hypothetical protein
MVHFNNLELSSGLVRFNAMGLSRLMAHFGLLELYLGGGSLPVPGTLNHDGSLPPFGALWSIGSLH